MVIIHALTTIEGADGLRLWDLVSRTPIHCPPNRGHLRGQVSALAWTSSQSGEDVLCYGTGLGYIIILQASAGSHTFTEVYAKRLGTGAEITCLAIDDSHFQHSFNIVTGTRGSFVQLWNYDFSNLTSVFSVLVSRTIPKAVAFSRNRTEIYMFDLHKGEMYVAAIVFILSVLTPHKGLC